MDTTDHIKKIAEAAWVEGCCVPECAIEETPFEEVIWPRLVEECDGSFEAISLAEESLKLEASDAAAHADDFGVDYEQLKARFVAFLERYIGAPESIGVACQAQELHAELTKKTGDPFEALG